MVVVISAFSITTVLSTIAYTQLGWMMRRPQIISDKTGESIFRPASFQRHVALGKDFLGLNRTSEGDDVAGRSRKMQQRHETGLRAVEKKNRTFKL